MPNETPDEMPDDELLQVARGMGGAAKVAADPAMDPELRAIAESALERTVDQQRNQ